MGEVERPREVSVSRRNIALCIESTGHSQRWPAFASDKLGTMLVLLVERADPRPNTTRWREPIRCGWPRMEGATTLILNMMSPGNISSISVGHGSTAGRRVHSASQQACAFGGRVFGAAWLHR